MDRTYNGDPYEGHSSEAVEAIYRHVNDLCEGCELCGHPYEDEGGEGE